MVRVKRGVISKQKHNKLLAEAKGYRGTRSSLVKTAREAVLHAGEYAFHGRKRKKRDFRRIWIVRINEALKAEGKQYSRFVSGMKSKNIALDRKILANLVQEDPETFKAITQEAFKK